MLNLLKLSVPINEVEDVEFGGGSFGGGGASGSW